MSSKNGPLGPTISNRSRAAARGRAALRLGLFLAEPHLAPRASGRSPVRHLARAGSSAGSSATSCWPVLPSWHTTWANRPAKLAIIDRGQFRCARPRASFAPAVPTAAADWPRFRVDRSKFRSSISRSSRSSAPSLATKASRGQLGRRMAAEHGDKNRASASIDSAASAAFKRAVDRGVDLLLLGRRWPRCAIVPAARESNGRGARSSWSSIASRAAGAGRSASCMYASKAARHLAGCLQSQRLQTQELTRCSGCSIKLSDSARLPRWAAKSMQRALEQAFDQLLARGLVGFQAIRTAKQLDRLAQRALVEPDFAQMAKAAGSSG